MDGHAVLAALRANVNPGLASPAASSSTADNISKERAPLIDVMSDGERETSTQEQANPPKRRYVFGRKSRKGFKPHKPPKKYIGEKDGLTKVRRRAARLQKRIGIRVHKLAGGGGLPKRKRKAVRRDAVLDAAASATGPVACKPMTSESVSDAAWVAGVERVTCGARNERFELLRRLTLGNLPFVASMRGATVAGSPNMDQTWWQASLARGWQLRLHSGEVAIAGAVLNGGQAGRLVADAMLFLRPDWCALG